MRNLLLSTTVLALLVSIVACGPSGREVAKAKTTRYQADKLVLFAAAKTATEGKYKLAVSDETTLKIQTTGRWYSPEGLASGSQADLDIRQLLDKSLNIALVVKLLPEATNWVVHIEPIMLRYNAGMPNPDKVAANDASLPGWATGKVDQLAYDIYDALKQYEVKSPIGIAPATAAPAADPAPAPAPTP